MQTAQERIAYIATESTITIVLDNQTRTVQVKSKSHRNGVILALEKFKKSSQSPLDKDNLEAYLAPIKRFVLESDNRFELDDSGKRLYLRGTKVQVPTTLADKIMDFLENSLPVDPLVKFWESCLKNPHYVAVTELFAFLEENHLPITDDGGFLGYKKLNIVGGKSTISVPDEFEELILGEDNVVRSVAGGIVTPNLAKQYARFINEANNPDMVDVHSGTIHQKVGEFVRIERIPMATEARRQECGYGLHIGAFSYSFSGNIRVLCKVMPEDVIACNEGQAKLRTCKYQIVSFVDSAKEVKDLLVRLNSQEQDIANGEDFEDDQDDFDNDFNAGDEVTPYDDDDNLTEGSKYYVLEADGDQILIVDDSGNAEWHIANKFEEII